MLQLTPDEIHLGLDTKNFPSACSRRRNCRLSIHCPFKHRSDCNDKKVRQLQTNSNILIASLAAAGLLVGAVCMPLTISLDTRILRGYASENVICTRVLVAMVVLYTAWSASFYHLVIISWERYLAIVKRVEYKIIIAKSRVKKYAGIAWVIAFMTIALFFCIGRCWYPL